MHQDIAAGIRSIFRWSSPLAEKGPTEGNHRFTALTGSLLVPLLALIFFTGLFMDAWWHIHYVIGFVLIPVVALKLATTGYRALRYYTYSPIYRAAGPPDLVARVTAPLLVLSIATALATGVALFAEHSRSGVLSTLHTDSAVSSALLLGIHLLAHGLDALATVVRDLRMRLSRSASICVVVTVAALVLGIILAIVTFSSGVWPYRPHDRRDGVDHSFVMFGPQYGYVAAASLTEHTAPKTLTDRRILTIVRRSGRSGHAMKGV